MAVAMVVVGVVAAAGVVLLQIGGLTAGSPARMRPAWA